MKSEAPVTTLVKTPLAMYAKHRHSSPCCAIIVAILGLLVTVTALGQQEGSARIPQSVIAGGGGVSESGSLRVEGTIGQSVTGTSTGGSFKLEAGFWPNGVVPAPTLLSVDNVSGTFGGTVTLKATLSATGADLNGKLISFTLNGTTVGTATTGANGVATLNGVSLGGANTGIYPGAVTAQFAGDTGLTGGGGAGQLTVGKGDPVLQVAGGTFAYDGQPHPASVSITGVNNEVLSPLAVLYNGSGAVPINAGTYSISASFAGNQNYNSVTNNLQSIVIGKTNQTISFSPISNKTYGDPPFAVSANSSSGLSVTFEILSGPATISGTQLTITGAGTVTVRASQAGNNNYHTATPLTQSFNVARTNQTITFGALPNKTFGDADFMVNATANSGLSVSFAATGNCTVSGNIVHLTGAGSCTITASQAGNNNYNPATVVSQSFSVARLNQTITFGALADRTFGDADFTVTAIASSGLSVSFAATGNCTVSGNIVHLTGAGSCTITASQAGNNNYNAATSRSQSLGVARLNQTITFGALNDKTFGAADFTVGATASSGLLVSFASTGNCTVSGSTVHITGVGACSIIALQGGNSNYNPATSVPQWFSIDKANQTITFGALENKAFGDADFTVNATASSGLSVRFAATGSCTVSGNTVHLTGAGSCTITASQAGDGNYYGAPAESQLFGVARANQTITFSALGNKTFGDGDFTVSATASSGMSVSFTTTGSCTVAGNTIHLTGAGSCTITASQAGDGNYGAALPVPQSFSVARMNQTITFGALGSKTLRDPDFTVAATATSGLTVSYVASGNCTVNGSTIHLTGAGPCTITASQGGDTNFNPAAEIAQSFSINAVAGTPSITNATTNANTQTTSGLVISRNPADGEEVSHFKITGITGGSLFKNNGTTPISNGNFITFAEGNAGLKFTPGTTNGSFLVQASTSASDAGLASLSGGTVTAVITVNPLGGVLRFSTDNYSVAEGAGFKTITVERSGDTSQAVTVDYTSSDHSNPADFIPCNSPGAGFASSRCDFTTAIGSLRFAVGETSKTFNVLISQDSYVEGPETVELTLSGATGGAVFGVPQTAILSITDDISEPANNPIDTSSEFVRSQYHDFLNREPDAPGLAFWEDNIEKCNDADRRPAGQTVAECIDKQRESTAVAFFMSPEFQITGGFVYHLYKGSLTGSPNYDGSTPGSSVGRFPTSLEFMRDVSTVSEGIVVNNQISGVVVEANRNRLAAEFVLRPEFVAKYGALNNTLYVQELFNTTGIAATAAEKQALVDGLTAGTETKAGVLRKVVDGSVVISESNVQFTTSYGQAFSIQEYRRMFVFMEYIGYLRRNPDAAGFVFWLGKLNFYGGDPFQAEMVRSFILSPEYRQRFGQQ